MKYKKTEVFAQNLDETDKLAKHRNDFYYPKDNNPLYHFLLSKLTSRESQYFEDAILK